jgi:PAS domain S-box-containing protein
MDAQPAPREPDREARLSFETLFVELSSRFINVAPAEVDHEINAGLRRVSELFGLELTVLWQWSAAAPDVIVPTHRYHAHEGPQPLDPLAQDGFPWVRNEMLAGRTVAIPSLPDGLPAEATVDRESARLLGIKSNLTIPLSVGGEPPIGAVAFNRLGTPRDWPAELVRRLQLVAQVVTNALARRRADQALRDSEENSRATFDQAAVGIAHVALDGRWLRVNDRLCAIVGYAREELLQLTFQDITHPDDLEQDRHVVHQVLSGEVASRSIEKRYIRKDRSPVWINLTVSVARSASGEPRHFIGVVEDISERSSAQEMLRASEARLAAGAALAGLAYYEVDFETGIAWVDDRFRALYGLPPERDTALGPVEFWTEQLHPLDRSRVLELRQRLHHGPTDRLSMDYRFLNPHRGQVWIQHLACVSGRDASGRATRTYGVLRDITERKQTEDELRDLARRLIGAHEEERALLARELHDDVTQRLALLAIDVGRAELASPGHAQAQTVSAVREGLVRLSEDVHSLAYQLHPSVLDEIGLVEALRGECERRRRQGLIPIALDLAPVPDVVGREEALCLYRIAQEALNNVARHAAASGATVELRQRDDGMRLVIRDDGVGFDPEDRRHGKGLGLASMRERLRLVNGTLDVESAPGRGTAIVAWVPAKGEA